MLFHMLHERVSKCINQEEQYQQMTFIYVYIYILLHRLIYAIESRDRRTLLSAFKNPKRTTSKLQDPICLCPQSLLHVEDRFLDHLAKTLHELKGVWNPDRKEEKIEHCKNQGLASERKKNNSLSFGYDSMMKPQSSSEPRKRTLCLIRYRGKGRPTIPRFEHNSTRLFWKTPWIKIKGHRTPGLHVLPQFLYPSKTWHKGPG